MRGNFTQMVKQPKCHTKFGVPMVWREPKNHHADCYFCAVNTKGFNSKTKHAACNPDTLSARRPVDHSAEAPIPIFSGLPSLQSEDSGSSQDEDNMVTDLDFHISTSLEPSPLKRKELRDLVRDLCLSKQQLEVLASRLQQKALLRPDTKITLYRNRETEFLQYFTSKGDFFAVTMSKGFCWQWVCQNMNQLIGDSLSPVQNEV